MKKILVIAMALGLSACGSTDFFGNSASDTPVVEAPAPAQQVSAPVAQSAATAPSDVQTAPAAAAPVAQATRSDSAHCKALAKQRSIDAGFQGEDGDTQESVYNRTYSDCVAWDQQHNL